LHRHGIKVISGILEKEATEINQVFIKYITKKLPFVTVKIAQSLDGKIATARGDSRWISSASSRQFVHKLRSQVDAVLVGINTVLCDNPLLSCRWNGQLYKKQPIKIIVDSKLRLLSNLKIFSPHSPGEVIIATTKLAPQDKILYFRQKARIIITKDRKKRVDLCDLLKKLAQQGIAHILIEGGGEIIASALKMELIDRMVIFVAPKIIGGRQAPTAVEGEGINRIKEAARLEHMKCRKVGSELVIEGKLI
jgi:diaminohydroxyphosphoribosylaminopyrimidine deaminase/5-amino-6-(5-phosphoribosylamino)uracil reductase